MTESGDRALSASAKVCLASCASGRVAPTPGNSASSREGQDIIKAFSRIKDQKLQRKIVELAKEKPH